MHMSAVYIENGLTWAHWDIQLVTTKLLITLLRVPGFNSKTYKVDYLFDLRDTFVVGHRIVHLNCKCVYESSTNEPFITWLLLDRSESSLLSESHFLLTDSNSRGHLWQSQLQPEEDTLAFTAISSQIHWHLLHIVSLPYPFFVKEARPNVLLNFNNVYEMLV